MAGNQVRGLVLASKTKGWDPTVIPGVGSIANFDVDPGNYPTQFVGTLSDGNNDSWPDGYDVPGKNMNPIDHVFPVQRELAKNGTNNADPYPGFPKGSY